jgi:hypothetical protein
MANPALFAFLLSTQHYHIRTFDFLLFYMTPERYLEVGHLYRAALEVESDRRAAFLAQACGGDEALRQEVESLLGYQGQSGGIIDQPVLKVVAQ